MVSTCYVKVFPFVAAFRYFGGTWVAPPISSRPCTEWELFRRLLDQEPTNGLSVLWGPANPVVTLGLTFLIWEGSLSWQGSQVSFIPCLGLFHICGLTPPQGQHSCM